MTDAAATAQTIANATNDLAGSLEKKIRGSEITTMAEVLNFLDAWTAGTDAVARALNPKDAPDKPVMRTASGTPHDYAGFMLKLDETEKRLGLPSTQD